MMLLKRIDRSSVHLTIVAIIALLSVIRPNLAPILAAATALIIITEWLLFKGVVASTPANLSLVALGMITIVNPLLSVRPSVSFVVAMQMIICIALLFAVVDWISGHSRLNAAMIGLANVGIFLVLLAPFTVDWITDKFGVMPSNLYTKFSLLSQRVIHPNIMAGAVVVLLVTIATYLLFTWRYLRNAERGLFILAVLGLSGLLVATQSRGALIGAAVGFTAMLSLRFWNRWGIPLLGVGALLAFAVFWGTGHNLEFLMDSGASVRGASGRLEIWSHALMVIGDFPLTGVGLGNFTIVTELFYPFLIAGASQPHAHNLFLQIAVDLGTGGLVIWLSCLIQVMFCCIQAIRISHRHQSFSLLTGVGAGLLCGQLTMLVHGLTDAPLWATRPTLLVWVLWSIALTLPGELRDARAGIYHVQVDNSSTQELASY